MKFIIKPTDELIRARGFGEKGRVQLFIDNECNRCMAKYTPLKTGALRDSVTGIGYGRLKQKIQYARKQYYNKKLNHPDSARGAFWFETMKRNHRDDILRGAQMLTGASEVKK